MLSEVLDVITAVNVEGDAEVDGAAIEVVGATVEAVVDVVGKGVDDVVICDFWLMERQQVNARHADARARLCTRQISGLLINESGVLSLRRRVAVRRRHGLTTQ